ncbi:MAG: tetratricopeptide repeat protein [Rikenellaceae bacterium]
MKKIVFMLAAVFALSTSTSYAQKVDESSIQAKLAKVDADSQHEKKGTKAAAWLTRGDAYVATLTASTKSLYLGMDAVTMGVVCDDAISVTDQVVDSRDFRVHVYPYFTAYESEGKIVSWQVTKEVANGAAQIALDSYNKAFALDSSAKAKAKTGIQSLVDFHKQDANCAIEIADLTGAAEAYIAAVDAQSSPAYGSADPNLMFYAGYMYTIDSDANPSSCEKGEAALNRAIEMGYNKVAEANTATNPKDLGNIYYYMFHCAYGMRESDPEKLQTAKGYLVEGISKYPQNEKIFEGLLQLYTSEENIGDPSELLVTIEANIAADPTNLNAWFGRGRIYFALKNYDECIESFKKVVEINPQSFEGNYYLGLFCMIKGDDYLDIINTKTYSDQASLDKDVAVLNKLYGAALPYFEAAHELKPTDGATLESLKQLCFRLRDEPGVMEKYNKYNELWKAL